MKSVIFAVLVLAGLASAADAQCYSRSRSYAGYGYSYCAPAHSTPAYYAPPVIQTFSPYPPLSVTYQISLPNYASTGSTVYGYGHPVATGLDPASLLNSAGRYLQLSTDAASQGFQQYNQSAQVINAGNRQSMESQIRQQLAQQILQGGAAQQPAAQPGAVQPQPGAAPAQPGVAAQPAQGEAEAGPPASLQAVADTKCIRCHGKDRKEKNLDMRDLSQLDATKVREILKRIMSDDPAERMPPVKEPPLTVEEKIAFIAGAIGPSEKAAAEKQGGSKAPADPSVPPRPPMQPAPKLPAPKEKE